VVRRHGLGEENALCCGWKWIVTDHGGSSPSERSMNGPTRTEFSECSGGTKAGSKARTRATATPSFHPVRTKLSSNLVQAEISWRNDVEGRAFLTTFNPGLRLPQLCGHLG
jgi:hypothetical protein